VTGTQEDAHAIRRLLHDLSDNNRLASRDEATRIRHHIGDLILPMTLTPRIIRKYQTHVEDNLEWPQDTTPDEYAESLRSTVLLKGTASTSSIQTMTMIGLSMSLAVRVDPGVDHQVAGGSW
jgi:hypothetical protein